MENHTTQILLRLAEGDTEAVHDLMPRVYAELKEIAKRHVALESRNNSLQSTALLHEAYIRLINQKEVNWQGRSHFLAIASTVMRRILIDQARYRSSNKRGGGSPAIQLDVNIGFKCDDPADLIALNEVLTNLAELNPRHAKIVEMRFFGGLTIMEIAVALNVSESTVKKEWRIARAWLAVELKE